MTLQTILCYFGWHKWSCFCGDDYCEGFPKYSRFCAYCLTVDC